MCLKDTLTALDSLHVCREKPHKSLIDTKKSNGLCLNVDSHWVAVTKSYYTLRKIIKGNLEKYLSKV